mmetsp:Transcript_22109/g.71564  ORF Transcript_22109/g.71564 Transcript_22109/m.71564 type:complete len:202 (+) Transcript_22109:46-651(+)
MFSLRRTGASFSTSQSSSRSMPPASVSMAFASTLAGRVMEQDRPSRSTRLRLARFMLPLASRMARSVRSLADGSGAGSTAGSPPNALYLDHSFRYFMVMAPRMPAFVSSIMALPLGRSSAGSFARSTGSTKGKTRAAIDRFAPSSSVVSPQGRFQAVSLSPWVFRSQSLSTSTVQVSASAGGSSLDQTLWPSGYATDVETS